MNCCDSIFLSYPHICYRYYISLDPVPDRTLSCVKRPISSEQVTAWESFYAVGPYEGIPASRLELRERVLGGEARMWGEYIYGSAPLNTAWPRAAATAERLWSPGTYTNATEAKPRLARFRCLLEARGIPAGVLDMVASPYGLAKAGQPPPGPASCYEQ